MSAEIREGLRELCIRVRRRISNYAHWTQGCNARTAMGWAVRESNQLAVRWCAWGAALVELPNLEVELEENRHRIEYAFATMFDGISSFNDSHSHEEVLAALDEKIESLRG